MMDPVSKEWLHAYRLMRDSLQNLRGEQNKLKLQIINLLEENKRLTAELQENVKLRLSETDVGQLQQLAEDAVAAKDAAVKLWQAAMQQVEKQEEMLVGRKSLVATERSELGRINLQLREDNTKRESALSQALSQSMDEISRLKKELTMKNSDLDKCKADLSSAQTELDLVMKKNSELSEEFNQLRGKLSSMESSLCASDKTLEIYTEKISNLCREKSELSATISNLEDENKKLKSKMLIHERDAKESLRTAEQAVLEKQDMISKEELYQSEIKMLKKTIYLEKEKVILAFKDEIKDMQKKSSDKIKQLMSEIENLHKEIGEKQTLFERANREKQALESQADMLLFENSNGIPVSSSTYEDMCKRLTMAERTRDELELKVSSLEKTLEEVKTSKEEEIEYLRDKLRVVNERLRSLSGDFNQASSDRVKLSDEVTELKKKSSDLEKSLDELRIKYKNDTASLKADLQSRVQSLQQQLQNNEEHYRTLCFDLDKLLEAEIGISKRWQTAARDVYSQAKEKCKELILQKMMMRSHIYNLINILHQNNLPIPNEILIDLDNDEFDLETN